MVGFVINCALSLSREFINLFMTSKNKFSNSPIHEFKVLHSPWTKKVDTKPSTSDLTRLLYHAWFPKPHTHISYSQHLHIAVNFEPLLWVWWHESYDKANYVQFLSIMNGYCFADQSFVLRTRSKGISNSKCELGIEVAIRSFQVNKNHESIV